MVGDQKGRVGFGHGKAREVPEAIRKATDAARKHLEPVSLRGPTIPHQVTGQFGGGRVFLLGRDRLYSFAYAASRSRPRDAGPALLGPG